MLKGPTDSNLELALALSISMQEQEENKLLQEAEVLMEAGLEEEAIQKRLTLERFGFSTSRPVKTGTISISTIINWCCLFENFRLCLIFIEVEFENTKLVFETDMVLRVHSGTGISNITYCLVTIAFGLKIEYHIDQDNCIERLKSHFIQKYCWRKAVNKINNYKY